MIAPASIFVIEDALDAVLIGAFFFGLVFVVLAIVLGVADVGLGHDHGGGMSADGGHHVDWLGQINLATILAFVTVLGGSTYLLRNGAGIPALVSLLFGFAAAFAGGFAVWKFVRMLGPAGLMMTDGGEPIAGTIARVSSSLREGGTGEVTYVLNGVRQVSAARALGGGAIPRGTEVLIMRIERGIAYVEPWAPPDEADEWEQRFAGEIEDSNPAAIGANGHAALARPDASKEIGD